ncbi:putative deoxyuridine 5'triphosphatenucleotidohydrolase [Betaentomopoxvirus amoorei]|uniref:AMV107 n=1 Tax=Amsacta moorei entomopoxvirus TaxID=28321 RepID=Q9EMU2_AMEPV|nr:putative deoxyuridine 5'triphosphatenucleotidohydrolase [Amsacta moorei entomopoxvirus]AAG02813.1 AMV107 [Amsacta moorei entomopoxvirus]
MFIINVIWNNINNFIYYISYYIYKFKNKNKILIYNTDEKHSVPTCIDNKFINLSSNINITIPPHKTCKVNLGINLIIPNDIIGIITPVEELYSNMIDLKSKYIIPNNDNNIILYITNNSDLPYNINHKQNIAKILCIKNINPDLEYIFN